MGLRDILAKLGVSPETLGHEVQELKKDLTLKRLQEEGLLAAEETVVTAARKLLSHDPEAFELVARSARPIPASGQIYEPPAGPPSGADATETAIQTEMQKSSTPYHVAAAVVSSGAKLGGNA